MAEATSHWEVLSFLENVAPDVDSFNVITLNTPELEIWQTTYYSPFVWDTPYRKNRGTT